MTLQPPQIDIVDRVRDSPGKGIQSKGVVAVLRQASRGNWAVAVPHLKTTNVVGVAKEILAERLKEDAERVSDTGGNSRVSGSEPEGRCGGNSEPLARKAGQESAGTAEPAEAERTAGDRTMDGEAEEDELGKPDEELGDEPPGKGPVEKEEALGFEDKGEKP